MNIFQEVTQSAGNVEAELIGPTYPYWKNIKNPKQIGMSSDGNLQALARDVDGLIQYVEVLVSGKGASTTGGPLGNKYFMKTGGKCKDNGTGNLEDRYIYIDNVPSGKIPFVSSALGVNFTEFSGLIPGTMENLGALNPYSILQGFMLGEHPECENITLETINNENQHSQETHFVATADINNMREGFSSQLSPSNVKESTILGPTRSPLLPKDPIVRVYLVCIALIILYIIFHILRKNI